jgi:hypothetical protein
MTLIEREQDKENVCCSKLCIVDCADTKEHCHLLCGYSNTVLTNLTIKNLCIGDSFKTCIHNQIDE